MKERWLIKCWCFTCMVPAFCRAGDKSSSVRAGHNVGVLSIISGMDSRADKRAVSVATETGDRHHPLLVGLPSVQRDCFGRGRSICDCRSSGALATLALTEPSSERVPVGSRSQTAQGSAASVCWTRTPSRATQTSD